MARHKRTKKKYTKAQSNRFHFKRKFNERFGVLLNRHDIKEVALDIRKGNYKTRIEHTVTKSFYLMDIKGNECYVCFDNKLGTPITVITHEMVSEKGALIHRGKFAAKVGRVMVPDKLLNFN